MPTRREFLKRSATSAASVFALPRMLSAETGSARLVSKADLDYLRGLATATVRSATVAANSCGFPMVTPGGNYPAFWIRDFSMALGCGLIDDASVLHHLKLVAKTQNGPQERKLGSGAMVPPYAIADHINFDGRPVFYPGSYSSGEDQGNEPWGVLPPVDDHYEFVNIAYELYKSSKSPRFLREAVDGTSLFDRLKNAIDSPKSDSKSGLVTTDVARRAVGFGFCDSVYMTGALCFASLLRFRALGQLAECARALDDRGAAKKLESARALIPKSVEATFLKAGWLNASTGVSGQPDVWATLFALHLGVLSGQARKAVTETVATGVRNGTLTFEGAVRHVPTDRDFSKTTAWEKTAGVAVNRYQNGAYWHVPTGWLAGALVRHDRPLAKKVVDEMIAHFRSEDFREGGKNGAPWECASPDGYRQNRVYMASVTLPLRALSRLS